MEDWMEDIGCMPDEAEILEDADDEFFVYFRFLADKGQSLLRVDKFLVDRIENASRNRIQLAADAGFIRYRR